MGSWSSWVRDPSTLAKRDEMSLATRSIREAVVQLSNGSAGDYFSLLKPRVMSLVVFTALVGMLLAPR